MPRAEDRRYAPATLRNRAPILEVLRSVLPPSGLVLEIASGSGEHAVHFARELPALTWQPSDPSLEARRSIEGWIAGEGPANVLAPLDLDAASDDWPIEQAAAILCINMVHISPWAATEGLLRGASRILDRGAPLYLYGPYRRSDRPLEPSNHAFDLDLRRRDPRWGLRLLDDATALAADHGFLRDKVVDMPANNISVVYRKT